MLTIIKNETQYDEYCDMLATLDELKTPSRSQLDKIELLELLIETWDNSNPLDIPKTTPLDILLWLMDNKGMKAKDLAEALNLDKSTVSQILNGKREFSKDVIRDLAALFKVNQDLFNFVPAKAKGKRIFSPKTGRVVKKSRPSRSPVSA